MHVTNASASTRDSTLLARYGEPMKRIAAVRADAAAAAAAASAKKAVSIYTDARPTARLAPFDRFAPI
ncbi:hypothetical protein [Paraburkholderia diazotrophica]|uniref:hypothetical protein n=1 Tax=Paraburkholderia diazotrophica TaxID=667676 RepID=UPI00316BBC8A